MISRAISVAVRPKEEWPKIAEESTTVASLMFGFVLPLAAVGSLAELLQVGVFGLPFGIRVSPGFLVIAELFEYVNRVLGVLLAAFVVQKLAPTYQSSGDFTQSLKLVSYAQGPYWLAQALALLPFLEALAILVGLYGLYLAYVGLPFVMKTPQERVVPYLVVVFIVLLVIGIAVIGISSLIVGLSLVGKGLP